MFHNVPRTSVRGIRAFLGALFTNYMLRTVLNWQERNNCYFHDIDLQFVKLKDSRRKWKSSFVKLNDAGNVWTAALWVSRGGKVAP
jgi:hypothetical protein